MEKYLVIFDDAQKSIASHRSGLRKLNTLLQQQKSQEKSKECINFLLRNCLDRALLCTKKEPNVDRLIKFFCDFIGSTAVERKNDDGSSIEDGYFQLMMNHLLQRSLSTDKNVRLRACECISTILLALSVEAEISDELWDEMERTLTPRLRDKTDKVRAAVILALERLQSPTTENDTITSELIRVMTTDTSTLVRVAAVESIFISPLSLPHLIQRAKDIKSEVRIAVFKRFEKIVPFQNLNVEMKNTILKCGLNDRDFEAKTAARELALKWIGQLDNNVPKFLDLLKFQRIEEDAEQLAFNILDAIEQAGMGSTALKRSVRDSGINWKGDFYAFTASSIFWTRIRCEFARKKMQHVEVSEVIEALIPDTVILCEMLKNAHIAMSSLYDSTTLNRMTDKSSEQKAFQTQLSMKYLLNITSFIDSSDISGGEKLVEVCNMLC